jgi:drug/metabolite transporter (DMT)-like permease
MVVFSRERAASGVNAAEWENLVTAVGLVAGAACLWGVYAVAIKWCMRVLPPSSAFLRVLTFSTFGFLVLAPVVGTPGAVVRLPLWVGALVFFSGILCIAVAHLLYSPAIQRLGVAVCSIVILASPVVAATASRVLFDDPLTPLQVLSAVVLLGGAAAAIHARARLSRIRRRAEAAKNAGHAPGLPG